jgi:hypothetical protein
MFKIPTSFSKEEEGYITIPPMKRFIQSHGLVTAISSLDRQDCLRAIESFAEQSNENKEGVFSWLDEVLKEGHKEIITYFLDNESSLMVFLRDATETQNLLATKLATNGYQHIIGNDYSQNIRLMKYSLVTGDDGRVLSLAFCRKLSCNDKPIGARVVLYPVFIDIYLDRNLLIGRAKPKAGLYEFIEPFVAENAKSTNSIKQMHDAIGWLERIFGGTFEYQVSSKLIFQQRLYDLLDRCTFTPDEIAIKIDDKRGSIERVISDIESNICELTNQYHDNLSADVYNMIEKYLSMSTDDKSIFTRGRDAYPLKIRATDEEDSKVEQTSAYEEPLQSKAIFFDNKKMMQVSKCCDGVYFMFERSDHRFQRIRFQVNINASRMFCVLKFPQYTDEEDILHAVFSLIGA